MDCIGAFSEILYSHPNILCHILPIITSAIRNPEVALCATMALKDLSRDVSDRPSCTYCANQEGGGVGQNAYLVWEVSLSTTNQPKNAYMGDIRGIKS